MRDALDAYRVAQQRRGLSKETIARRKYTYWAFEAWLGRDILTATREEIETWLDSLGLAPRARYCYISNLHTLYDFCVREQYMEVDPTLKIERPKLPRNVPRPVSEADLAHALSLAPPRERAMISLGAYEGLRCKEIAALEREDILEHEDPPLLIVTHGKGGKQRILPLNERVEMALRSFGLPRRGPVFPRPDGRPISSYTVGQTIARFLRDVGVDATAHQLRHYFGTKVYRETADLRMVQELLGHSSPAVTAVYAQRNPTAAAEVVRKLGAGTVDPRQGSLL